MRSTLLSSPTVGRGRCPSLMTECLHAGFAFIMMLDCPATRHEYMTGVARQKMLHCLYLEVKGFGTLLLYGEILICRSVSLSFLSFSMSALPKVRWPSLPENMRNVYSIQLPARAFSSTITHKYVR